MSFPAENTKTKQRRTSHLPRGLMPVVQKQVGHKTLKVASVYLNPSEETVAQAYEQVRPTAALVGRLAREALYGSRRLKRWRAGNLGS